MEDVDCYSVLDVSDDPRSFVFRVKCLAPKVKPIRYSETSRQALGHIQPPIQSAPVALSSTVKRPEPEADHWFPYNADVMNKWSHTYSTIC
jgi:hypothetical protein